MMKRIIILCLVVIAVLNSYGQTFPINSTNGTPKTRVLTLGVSASDSGYQYRTNFADTIAANRGGLKNLPGVQIRAGDTLYHRSEDLSHWIKDTDGGGGSGETTLVLVSNVTAMRALPTSAVTTSVVYYLQQAQKQGIWKYDASDVTTADNGGTVIVTPDGRRIKREIGDGIIQLDWFDVPAGFSDAKPALRAALNVVKFNPTLYSTLQMSGRDYGFFDSVQIDFPLNFFGAQISNINPKTILNFSGNIAGLSFIDAGVTEGRVEAQNFTVKQINNAETYRTAASRFEIGIEINTIVHFFNVNSWNFQGDAFVIHGNGTEGTNTDQSSFFNCKAREPRRNGFYLYGEDANIINFTNCEAVATGGAGWYDNGFLGNYYANNHCASVSSTELAYQRGCASYLGILYYTIADSVWHGTNPLINTTEWRVHPNQAFEPFAPDWHTDTMYLLTGAYLILSETAFASLWGNYAEQDCTPSSFNSTSFSFGGDFPAHGLTSGLLIRAFNGYLDVNSRFQAQSGTISQPLMQLTSDALYYKFNGSGGDGIVIKTGGSPDYTVGVVDGASYAPFSGSALGDGSIASNLTAGSFNGRTTNDFAFMFISSKLHMDDQSTGGRNYKQLSMGSAAPTTGSNMIGDLRFHIPTTTGENTFAYRNAATASPGTWESLGIVPTGGTTGQVLTKSSNTAFDYTWSTPTGGVPTSRTITIAGTSNEISSSAGAQDLSADRTWTISLPATVDLGGKTSFEIPNSAAPTVDAFGEIAGDDNIWAASRGTGVFFDGTAATAFVNVLVSDAPSNGQVPTWNTGGTITWETISAGGLTIGTTSITSGTDTRILYQSSGVVSQSANLVFNASNEFIVGGTDYGAFALQVTGQAQITSTDATTASIRLVDLGTGGRAGTYMINDAGSIGTIVLYGSAVAATQLGVSTVSSMQVINSTGSSLAMGTLNATPVVIATTDVERIRFNAIGSVVINDVSADLDFRVEGDGDANLFITDAGTDKVTIGTSTVTAKLGILSTTEQFRTLYDASNYMSVTVASTGSTTLNLVGTSPTFTFSDPVIITTIATTSGAAVSIDGTQTLTNKRVTKRSATTASTSSLTIASDDVDIYTVTALAANLTINAPSGTPTVGQTLIIRITDNGTGRTLTWNAAFRAFGTAIPTTTTANLDLYVGCIWNSTASTWDVTSVVEEL